MSEAAAAQAEEIRRILLNRHLDNVFSGTTGPKRPGSAPPQAEVLPGSPMGPAPGGYNIITGEPMRGVSGGQQLAAPAPASQPMSVETEDLGLAQDTEEALRSRPDYVAYYYANVRNNPRLPPPLPARNVNAPWADNGKTMTADALAEVQGKSEEAQAQATYSMLFGSQLNLKNGAEPIPIRNANYLGQDLGPQVSSSRGGGAAVSPPDTLAAAWANINATPAGSAAQQLDSLLGAFGSPKPGAALSPLLAAELKAQVSGVSLYSARSADEQAMHEALYSGSTPHTPIGSQHGGTAQLFSTSYNPSDSPRPPAMDVVGRSMSSNSLGGGSLNKDPKVNPAPGPGGRLASVIGEQRASLRTPSKLRIGSTVADPDPQQQLLQTLASANAAAADSDGAAVAAAAAAVANLQQLASVAQAQAAMDDAFTAVLRGADQAGIPVARSPLVGPDILLGGAQQQQIQAMYMAAAAMYPMYYNPQAAGVQQGLQQVADVSSAQAMQRMTQALQSLHNVTLGGLEPGYPGMAGAPGAGAFPGTVPNAVNAQMLPGGYPPHVIAGTPAATLFGAGVRPGMTDVAALAAAGLRPSTQQPYAGIGQAAGGLAQQYPPAGLMMQSGSGDYSAYYQKMLEAQAAMAMAGGAGAPAGHVPKDADPTAAAAALLRPVPPPPPPPGQPPHSKDKRNGACDPSGGAAAGMYGHVPSELERRGRNNSSGRGELERLAARASGSIGSLPAGPGLGSQGVPNSRLRGGSGTQQFVLTAEGPLSGGPGHGNHGGGGSGLISHNSGSFPGAAHGAFPREPRGPDGAAAQPRRNSQRRDGGPDGPNPEPHSGGGGHGRGPRSSGDTLLDEFKSNKTGRKYELREILGHVYEFSLDQHGSRFIQQKLEGVAPEDLDAAFSEVLPRILHLMTDVFGNYVVQKFLEHGTVEHRARLAKALHGHVLQLSLQMYGCRVVQKALEVFAEEQQVELVAELDGHIMRCVRDQNGNHVIQKCIECVPTPRITGLLDTFLMCVVPLSTHPFGCRIIQRILEHVRDQRRRSAVMVDILAAAVQLTQDQYGNYVIQHVLERGTPEERSSIAGSLSSTVVQLSMHKFASNVIEKCLTYGSTADRDLLINRMLGAQALQMQQAAAAGGVDADVEVEDPVQAMMKDQFGNYVVQKVLEVCSDDQRETMLARVRQQLHALKRYTYGKHIVARVEKLLSAGTRYQTHAKGRLLPDDEALAAVAAAAAAAGAVAGRAGSFTGGMPPLGATSSVVTAGDSGPSVDSLAAKSALERSDGSAASDGRDCRREGAGGSDGGASAQPSAPTTPPVSSGSGESGYSGLGLTTEQAAAAAAPAEGNSPTATVELPSSGLAGVEAAETAPLTPAAQS